MEMSTQTNKQKNELTVKQLMDFLDIVATSTAHGNVKGVLYRFVKPARSYKDS